MNAGDTHYVASNGTPALKKALCKKLLDDNQLEYDPSEILVTPGGKQALFAAMLKQIVKSIRHLMALTLLFLRSMLSLQT